MYRSLIIMISLTLCSPILFGAPLKTEVCRKYEIDVKKFPAVVIESDDWGVEMGVEPTENPERLQRLFDILAKHKGADGLPAVITAFTCMANPDYEAIRKNGFNEYKDIPIFKSAPEIVKKYQEGIASGVWEVEYHANLHHISPKLWVKLLKEKSPAGDEARHRFEKHIYAQGYHIPEYNGYTIPEQFELIKTGFDRFKIMFGRLPKVAVTSDAYPETVMLWAVAGAHSAALANTYTNEDVVTVYHTKPWNFQDPYIKLGDYNPKLDLIYLTRNLNFEKSSLEEGIRCFERNLKTLKEPSVIQLHRGYICNKNCDLVKERVKLFDRFLGELSKKCAIFITSGELSDLYRLGYSIRKFGNKTVLRKWSKVEPPKGVNEAFELPSMKKVIITENSIGNFILPQ